MRLFRSTNIDFHGLTKACVSGSLALIAISTLLLFTRGLNWGVDFTGGTQVIYAFTSKPDEAQIRKIVEGAKVPIASVQRYDKAEKNEVLLRVPMEKKEGRDVSGEVARGTVEEKMLSLQSRKREVIDALLGGEGQSGGDLNWEEIQELLA